MAALKAVLKSLDGLADPIKELYRKDGEDYRLDVEGMAPKAALDEFRENNVALKKTNEDLAAKLKGFDGIDVEKVKELQETERKVKDGELIKAGKLDELKHTWLEPVKKELQAQLDDAKRASEQLAAQLEVLTIDNKLAEIGNKKGLIPTAMQDFMERGRKVFKLKDGRPVAIGLDGTQAIDKSGNPLTMETWTDNQAASEAPHLFQKSSGGGAPQNPGHSVPGAKVMRRAEFDKLDSAAKMKFSVEKGALID